MPLREVAPFVAGKQRWIERTLRRYRQAEEESPSVSLVDGGSVPYLGSELRLRVRVEPGRVRPHVARRGEDLRVAATARAGSEYTSLSIRGQRTRWASCSNQGSMSFNWRLLLAPEEILDYVVEHEVAHLEVLGHSQRFWRLLASRCPDYREHERWLRKNGAALRL